MHVIIVGEAIFALGGIVNCAAHLDAVPTTS